MIYVNRYFIDDILGPLGGLADSEQDIKLYATVDSNNKSQICEIFRKVIKPDFDQKSELVKVKSKRALAFYLITDKANFKSIFHSCLLPLNTPENEKIFFIWLWESLFDGEDYNKIDIHEFVEKNDIDEPWQILIKYP